MSHDGTAVLVVAAVSSPASTPDPEARTGSWDVWQLVPCALWCTWLVALALTVARLDARERRRLAVPLLVVLAAWSIVEVVLFLTPLPWHRLATLRFGWSLLGGVACALIARTSRHPSQPAASARPLRLRDSWGRVLGCGLLLYLATVAGVALVTALQRAFDPSARQVLSPAVFAWAIPGFAYGMLLGLLFEWRAEGTSARTLANFFIGLHVLVLGAAAVVFFSDWAVSRVSPPHALSLVANRGTVSRASLAFLAAPLLACAPWIALAPSGRRVLTRACASLALVIAAWAQLELATEAGALWHRSRALADERAPDVALQRRAIDAWQRYLSTFPETDERSEVLWRIATSYARLGDEVAARAAFASLAAGGRDAAGPRWIRWGRMILDAGPTPGARIDATVAPVVPAADYLTPAWRSALGLLASAQAAPKLAQLLVGLRTISLVTDRIRLPPLTSLFEVKAYGRLLGVRVRLEPLDVARLKTRLTAGDAVLLQRRDEWFLLVGFDPRWRTFLYYEYGRETDAMRRDQARQRAQALVDDGRADDGVRRLRAELLDEIPEADVERALADAQHLVATLRSSAAADDPDEARRDEFLIAELAMSAGDPIMALDHYFDAAAGSADAAWLLPYVHVAVLAAEKSAREVIERRLPTQPLVADIAAWKADRAHAAFVARADAAFAAVPSSDLPSPVLARLAALLDPYDPADRTVRATAYDVLTRRYPEDVPYLTGLAETYQVDEPSDTLADVYERLAALQLDDKTYRMHLAETLLGLGRAAEARAVLACVREHGGADEGRLLGLEGRTALALAEPERAMTLLRAALDKHLGDADLRSALARALEARGDMAAARKEWPWVELTSVDSGDRTLAHARLEQHGTP